MLEAFRVVDPGIEEADFLERFRTYGCYLVDLCPEPVDRLCAAERREACVAGEAALSRAIRRMQPLVVVVMLRSIAKNVRRAVEASSWTGRMVEVAYPGRWVRYRASFVAEVGALLAAQLGD